MNWQTLAPELIFEILSKFLPGLTLPVIEPKFFPWYLGHICSSWSLVFKSSSQFWSALIIDLEGDGVEMIPHRSIERALLLTEMCIQQSKTHPLSFQFKFKGQDFEVSHCHKMLKAMMAHSSRWLDAYFYLSHREVSMLYAIKTQLPILRAFRLTCHYNSDDENLPQFGDLFEDAFQLKRAYISNYMVWKLNWSSITTIHLYFTNEVEPELLLIFLQRIEHLEDLYNDGYTSFESLPFLPKITLPFLRCLGASTMEILLLFEAPVLEELYIKTVSDMSAIMVDEVASKLLGQPLSHLKRLVLYLRSIKMGVKIFQYLPDIQDISFYVWDLSILEFLPLCPTARHLRFLETMTVGVAWPYDPHTLSKIWNVFRIWRMQSNAATGFGHFKGLKRFALELRWRGYCTKEEFDKFEYEFTNLFSERGVQCTIRHVGWLTEYSDTAVPPFDFFGGKEADYYCNYGSC